MITGGSARAGRTLVSAGLAIALLTGCGLFADDPSPEASQSETGSASGSTSGEPSATGSADPLAAYYEQRVRWRSCGGGFDCTDVKVPLDYADPAGEQTEISVVRLKAKKPRGSLLLNPGGPGASAVDYTRAARAVLTKELVRAYDVVGFDPRGVVHSDPVDCVTDKQVDQLVAADGTPDSPAEEAEVARVSAKMGAGCKAKSPVLAAQMGTMNSARDMDILRAVLGDDKLNYLGKSYGTYLGAAYAELFPERVGRIVLDGVLPSSLDADEVTFGQAKAFDVALRHFVADCLEQEDCPFTGTVDSGVARIQRFLKELDTNPIPGVGDRKLNESMATYAILSAMYSPTSDWGMLSYGLAAAFRGDGSVLMDMMDGWLQRNPDGTYANNGNEAFYAVSCLDRPGLGGVDHVREVGEKWAIDAPVFGTYLAWGSLPCWDWPLATEGSSDLRKFTAKGSDPILVVSTKYDPATPYDWGVQVSRELDNATLLTYDADGHTAYTSGSTCIDKLVDAYFLEGTLPTDGVVCKPDA